MTLLGRASALLLLSVALAGGGCGASQPKPTDLRPPARPMIPTTVDELIDPTTRAIVTGATKVEALRLQGMVSREPSREPVVAQIGGYNAVAKITPDRATLGRLLAALFNEKTYSWGGGSRCLFMPGLGLRFEKGSSVVEILLCFSCTEVMITTIEGSSKSEVRETFRAGEAELAAIRDSMFGPPK